MPDEFDDKLIAFAKQSVIRAGHCSNEESTKLFLVLPFITFLGFDTQNPLEVSPEHAADFSDKYKNRVDYAITLLAEKPSDVFTRMLLKAVGIQNVRDKSLPEYQDLVGAAFREFVNVKILERLKLTKAPVSVQPPSGPLAASDDSATLEVATRLPSTIELEALEFAKQRVAFLVSEESLFIAIQKIDFHDYQGKFLVYYEKERRGRLFDFIEGGTKGPKYRFTFPDSPDDVTADKLVGSIIDAPLLSIFKKRVNGDASAAVSPSAAN